MNSVALIALVDVNETYNTKKSPNMKMSMLLKSFKYFG